MIRLSQHGELGVEVVLLRHDAEPGADAAGRRPRDPCRARAARRRSAATRSRSCASSTSCPRRSGPRKPNASPGSIVEVDAVDRDEAAEALRHVGTPDQGLGARNRHERRRYRFPGARHRGLPASVRGLRLREQRELPLLREAVHADEAEITQPRELHAGQRQPVRAIGDPDVTDRLLRRRAGPDAPAAGRSC